MTRAGRSTDKAASARVFAALLLAGATLAAFSPVLSAGFVIYDDERYVVRNPNVHGGLTWESLRWALTSGYASNWHPLTWLSHQLDWRLYGAAAWGHHLTSLLLHVANVLLLFVLLDRATGETGRSAFAAGLFALHPLHVESVAWVAERKDVLSTLLWLLATAAYVRWTRKGGSARYLLVGALFAAGLAAKPMLVTFPLALLVLDYWPLARWRPEAGWRCAGKLVAEKAPLLALSAASAAVTLGVQAAGTAVGSTQEFPLAIRLGNALVAYAAYLGKTVRPVGLAVFYPHPGATLPFLEPVAAAVLLVAVTLLAVRLRRSSPYLLAGWLWYLLTLVPVIGLVQVGEQAMADRYTYVPLAGIFVAAAWGIPDLARAGLVRRGGRQGADDAPLRWALPAAGAAALLALALLTRAQAATWKSSVTLFEHAVAVTEGNYLAHLDLGTALSREGRRSEALAHYEAAARIRPDDAQLQYNLGVTLAASGRDREAQERYERALALRPEYPEAHNNLGILLARQGRIEDAVRHCTEAVRLRPDFAEARFNLAVALHMAGRDAEAREQVEAALRLGFTPPPDLVRRLSGERGETPAPR